MVGTHSVSQSADIHQTWTPCHLHHAGALLTQSLQGHLGNSFTPNPPDRSGEAADLTVKVVGGRRPKRGTGIDLSLDGTGIKAGSLSPPHKHRPKTFQLWVADQGCCQNHSSPNNCVIIMNFKWKQSNYVKKGKEWIVGTNYTAWLACATSDVFYCTNSHGHWEFIPMTHHC